MTLEELLKMFKGRLIVRFDDIQHDIGFGTCHPYQGNISITREITRLIMEDNDFKKEVAEIIIMELCNVSNYHFKNLDVFEDVRDLCRHKLFSLRKGLNYSRCPIYYCKYGLLIFQQDNGGYPGVLIYLLKFTDELNDFLFDEIDVKAWEKKRSDFMKMIDEKYEKKNKKQEDDSSNNESIVSNGSED